MLSYIDHLALFCNFSIVLTQRWHCFFCLIKKSHLKRYLLFPGLLLVSFFAKAQKIDSIYVNLYTDSLKKGSYNYINVDGLLSNGRYLPLDSTYLLFEASSGRFSGNSLWLDKDFAGEKVHIKVSLRKNRAIFKEFDIYVKKKADDEQLKTADEILRDMRKKKGS